MLQSISDTKRTIMHPFLFTNSAKRELVSICTHYAEYTKLQLTFLTLQPCLHHSSNTSKYFCLLFSVKCTFFLWFLWLDNWIWKWDIECLCTISLDSDIRQTWPDWIGSYRYRLEYEASNQFLIFHEIMWTSLNGRESEKRRNEF